jgi:hypothetical protein
MRHRVSLLFAAMLLLLAAARGDDFTTRPMAAPRLTLELKGGSRVVGQSDGGMVRMRSASLGDIQLPMRFIRAMRMTADGETGQLTAVNGDVLNVRLLVMDEIALFNRALTAEEITGFFRQN